MEKNDKNNIDFVLRYYEVGKLDTQKAMRQFMNRTGIRREQHPWRYVSIAATLLVLIVAGTMVLFHKDTTSLTACNAVKTFLLPDRTKVTLAPHATLTYTGDDCRKVTMTGKIYFEVKHDEAHPFDIKGDMSHVRVLGTKFMVSEGCASSEVYVISGRVLFTAKTEADGVILTKEMRATLAKGAKKPQIAESGSVNQMAWATHKFHFDNTPVNEVLNTLSCYYSTHLSANNTGKRLSGDFDANDLDDILSIIEETLNIKISQK